MSQTKTQGYELDWTSSIENDSTFTLLPNGDYDFEVVSFERGRYTPGPNGKLPECNKAVLSIKVTDEEGQSSTITHNLFLHSSTEGMLCAFFTGIGQRKHGEKFTMNWNAVIGSKGRCKIGTRKWKGNDGEERESNEIKEFYEPESAAPATGFTPGSF